MKKQMLLALLVVILMVGCAGEDSVTGSFDFALSGQILAAGDLAGASNIVSHAQGSPVAGVEVRARGTGVASVSDAAGRFALIGLPASVELTFTRSDGINARANVNVASSPSVVVELAKSQATVIPTGQSKREIEGLITAISPTEISVDDASTHMVQTAAINEFTIIRHGNLILTTLQLKIGDRVHVRALINDDGSLTAFEIMLQNSGSGPAVQQLEGLIVTVSAACDELTMQDASRGEVDVKITSETKIRKGNSNIPCSQLKENDLVHVKATLGSDGTYTALEIKLQNPA